MKKLYVFALGLFALPAFADNNKGFYVGAGGSSIEDYQDGINDMSHITAVEIFGGYKYNDALGVELRLGNGKTTGTTHYSIAIKDENGADTGNRSVLSFKRQIDNYQAIYYKPELVNEEAKLYALLGYSWVHSSGEMKNTTVTPQDGKWVQVDQATTNTDRSGSGYSYGLGVGFVVDNHFNINIEYKNICDDISGKPNVISVNADYRF